MTKDFTASNGFTVRETPGTLAIHVHNLYIGEGHFTALHEYFTALNASTH